MVAHLSDREISAAIIESCRLGDRDAFRALYDIHKDKVYSISLYFFHGDQAMASDVTQQVFLKLMTGIAQFRGDAEFSTWLYRLVVNACMDAARRQKPDAAISEAFAAPDSQEEDYARVADGELGAGRCVGSAGEIPYCRLIAPFRGSFLRADGEGFALFHGDGGFAAQPGT